MVGHLKMKEKCHLNYFVNVLTKKSTKKNKRIESKLYSDARQTEKKLKSPTQNKKSTSDFKVKEYNISALLNWSKNWKTYVFLYSKTRSVV